MIELVSSCIIIRTAILPGIFTTLSISVFRLILPSSSSSEVFRFIRQLFYRV